MIRGREPHLRVREAYAAARAARADELDQWLGQLLTDAMAGAHGNVALVAVGSYGRRELTPGSDLDLVLVHRGHDGIGEIADRLWYPVWDSGTRLDHAVRTVAEARTVARADLKAVLGLIYARHVAGDPGLTRELRETVLADWRSAAPRRLPELAVMTRGRWERHGELAFLLEPDLKEARGGLRDVHTLQALAAAWTAPGPRVNGAYSMLLDVRHALHEVTGRAMDRLVFQEQDPVARKLGLLDADALLRALADAARTVSYAADQTWRDVDRHRSSRPSSRRTLPVRRPLADGIVEQEGEAVLAHGVKPGKDPVLVLRAAAAAAGAGVPLAPATLDLLAAESPRMPVPWPREARDAFVALLGAGPVGVGVWEALDQAGLVTALLPDWERVRNRPQRDPVHTFTVDRHLVETAARAAALCPSVARPDLLLIGALLHDIGKGWPGDHSHSGAVMARDIGHRMGLPPRDTAVLEMIVRHHLLLPETALRRDLDDPATAAAVAGTVGSHEVLELLAALAIADGEATGPAAWGPWKAGLVADLVRRVARALAGRTPPPPPELNARQLALARHGGGAVRVVGSRVTVVAPDRPGLLWRAAGVLALHRLAVRAATAVAPASAGRAQEPEERAAVIEFEALPEFGAGPDPAALEADLRRLLAGRLDVAARLERAARSRRVRPAAVVSTPRITFADDVSRAATVVELRASDRPGLLWRIGQALDSCGLQVVAARVDTLGASAVDVFYVTGPDGVPVTDPDLRAKAEGALLSAARP